MGATQSAEDWYQSYIKAHKRATAAEDRISSLEQRVKELEEALKRILDILGIQDLADAMDLDVITQQADGHEVWEAISKAREVLCHADASRADSPHRADGAPQSEDGDTR